MNKIMDAKILLGLLIALTGYFFVKRDVAIDENTAATILTSQTLINISHQLSDVTKNQRDQTERYVLLSKKVHDLSLDTKSMCSTFKMYGDAEGWAKHPECREE